MNTGERHPSEQPHKLKFEELPLEEQLKLLKNHVVFVGEEALPILDNLKNELSEFMSSVEKLQRVFRNVAGSKLGRFAIVRSISEAYIGSFTLTKLKGLLREIGTLAYDGRCSLPELVATTRPGAVLSGHEIEQAVARIIHDGCISGIYDIALAGVEKFRHLKMTVPLNQEDQNLHDKWIKEIENHIVSANNSLKGIGVEPIELPYLSPITNQLAPYVRIAESDVPIENYYPEQQINEQSRELILDCKRWAYLDKDKKLWSGQPAQIVISH